MAHKYTPTEGQEITANIANENFFQAEAKELLSRKTKQNIALIYSHIQPKYRVQVCFLSFSVPLSLSRLAGG